MKSTVFYILIYLIFVAIACCVAGFCFTAVPEILPFDVVFYKITTSFSYFLTVLPSAIIAIYLLMLSIYFGKNKNGFMNRFSLVMSKCYKEVMVSGIIITLLLTVCTQVFSPLAYSNKDRIENAPSLLKDYLEMANHYIEEDFPNQAIQCAKKALAIDSKNEEATRLIQEAETIIRAPYTEINMPSKKESDASSLLKNDGNENTNSFADGKNFSVYELIQKSNDALKKQEWFNAHYYAKLAVDIADAKDVNLEKAKEASAVAWKKLSIVSAEEPSEKNKFFMKKLEGYKKLQDGDFLESYYIYNTLKNESVQNARDPDVVRFLGLAQRKILEEYFFIDETSDLQKFESATNICFSLSSKTGGYTVVLIDGVTDVAGSGHYLRYLRGLQTFVFDKYGDFMYSMKVPYAKMTALNTKNISDEVKDELGIDESIKIIPNIMLCSVDRDKRDVKLLPTYEYKEHYIGDAQSHYLLPVPYEDFSLLMQGNTGLEKMNPFSLFKMISKADFYGFSSEVFLQTFMLRIFYPLWILILLIFVATIAWNYRLAKGSVFKFVWIFVIPILNFIIYILLTCVDYAAKLLNYSFISIAKEPLSIFVGLGFYTLVLILVSLGFLSRTGD